MELGQKLKTGPLAANHPKHGGDVNLETQSLNNNSTSTLFNSNLRQEAQRQIGASSLGGTQEHAPLNERERLIDYFVDLRMATGSRHQDRATTHKIAAALYDNAVKYGFDPREVMAQAWQESKLSRTARSEADAIGVMQIKADTAADYLLSRSSRHDPEAISRVEKMLLNPETNIKVAMQHLARMRDQYGWTGETLLAAYNAGEGATRRALRHHGHIPQYAETLHYVANISNHVAALNGIDTPTIPETSAMATSLALGHNRAAHGLIIIKELRDQYLRLMGPETKETQSIEDAPEQAMAFNAVRPEDSKDVASSKEAEKETLVKPSTAQIISIEAKSVTAKFKKAKDLENIEEQVA